MTITAPWPAPLHSRPSTAIGGLNLQSAASLEIGARPPPLRAGSIPTPTVQEGHRGGDGTGAVGELQGETVQQPRPPRGVVRHSVLVPGDKQWGREHRNTNRFIPHSRGCTHSPAPPPPPPCLLDHSLLPIPSYSFSPPGSVGTVYAPARGRVEHTPCWLAACLPSPPSQPCAPVKCPNFGRKKESHSALEVVAPRG